VPSPAPPVRITCLAATGTASTFRIASHRTTSSSYSVLWVTTVLESVRLSVEQCGSMGSSRSHTPSSPSSLTWRSEFPSTVLRVFVATGNRRISRYAARQMLFPKWVPRGMLSRPSPRRRTDNQFCNAIPIRLRRIWGYENVVSWLALILVLLRTEVFRFLFKSFRFSRYCPLD